MSERAQSRIPWIPIAALLLAIYLTGYGYVRKSYGPESGRPDHMTLFISRARFEVLLFYLFWPAGKIDEFISGREYRLCEF